MKKACIFGVTFVYHIGVKQICSRILIIKFSRNCTPVLWEELRLSRLKCEVINTSTSLCYFIFRGTLVDALTTMAYCSTLTKFFSHNTLKLPCSEIQNGLKHFLKEHSVFLYTRAPKYLNVGEFWLEIRVIIKILTQPCYPKIFDQFSW